MSAPMNPNRPTLLLLPLLCVLIAGAAFLVTPGCGDDEPEGVHIVPAAFDFGRIRHGEVKTQVFEIRNNSGVPVTLAKALTNCSCIQSSEPSRRRIDPGSSAKVTVRLTSGAVPAQRLKGKHLEIRIHEPKSQLLRAPIEGDIFAPVVLAVPDKLDKLYFGRIGAAESHTPRVVTARTAGGFTASIDTDVAAYPHGYAFRPPQLAALFDVEVAKVKRGFDFTIQLKKGATRPEDIVVRDPRLLYQLIGTLTFRLREEGPGLKPRVVPHTVGLHGTWPAE